MKHEALLEGQCYHIYNRGNNGCNLFLKPEDYQHFLNLYEIYIHPVAKTFTWVLMGNHFHLLVQIKNNIVYRYDLNSSKVNMENQNKWQTVDASSQEAPATRKKPETWRHFSHLFNAYSRYHQNRYGRSGNLFERPFKRKWVDSESYFKQVLLYIHQNPVHHGFCSHPLEYPWSGYLTYISEKPSWLQQQAITKYFGSSKIFEEAHMKLINKEQMDNWLNIGSVDYYTERPPDNNLLPSEAATYEIKKNENNNSDRVDGVDEEDLSACAASDNVCVENDRMIEINGMGINATVVNAVRSTDADRVDGVDEKDLSACAAPDNVYETDDKRSIAENRHEGKEKKWINKE